jgi:hypothetical protein
VGWGPTAPVAGLLLHDADGLAVLVAPLHDVDEDVADPRSVILVLGHAFLDKSSASASLFPPINTEYEVVRRSNYSRLCCFVEVGVLADPLGWPSDCNCRSHNEGCCANRGDRAKNGVEVRWPLN